MVIAAAFFGCAEQALEDAPEYDGQGRRLVAFSVPTGSYSSGGGGTRSLTQPIAQAAWDYGEVVFYKGTEYYVGSAARGNDIRFNLPESDGYKAVMLLGIGNGNRLLGVGVPSISDADINKGSDGAGNINLFYGG
ncbi:MAG: hypothetical protein LBK25_09525 [Treponema sp.]|nr:hypothetical protein [Treponema sp.]